MDNKLNVLELFAGVGGFRIGLENASKETFITKWANQWEPSTKSQDAFEVYNYRFPNSVNLNDDITTIPDSVFAEMNADIIVGGFPCQDYSVARSKNGELGIEGKKGVLFWEIIRATKIISPKYLLLENVDRLLKSPSNQRGRDFAVMLGAFNKLGYSVEWRVINAADYGRAQRRRRVFIFVYRNDIPWAKKIDQNHKMNKQLDLFGEEVLSFSDFENYLLHSGLFAKQFPVEPELYKSRFSTGRLDTDIANISDSFSTRFWNSGVMRHGVYYTCDTSPVLESPITLGDIIQDNKYVSEEFFLTEEQIEKFSYLRGAKKIKRKAQNGHEYYYSEGGMSTYDSLELPARTMLTSEGTVNRSTHIVFTENRLRFITPIEAERIQDFPDDWTKFKMNSQGEKEKVQNRMRLFFMGNALVTGVVERIGRGLEDIDKMDKCV